MNPRKSLEVAKLNGAAERNPKRYANRKPSKMEGYEIMLNPPKFEYSRTRETWDSMIPALCSLGLISVQDSGTVMQMFEILDSYYATAHEWKRFRKEHTVTEIVTDPALEKMEGSILRRQMQLLESYTKIAYRFGITPVERMRLTIEKPSDKDEIDDILEG